MVTKQRQTIRQRIKSRLKGLSALAIAVVMVVSMLPVTEAKAAETGNYYFAVSYGNVDGILGNGTVPVTAVNSFADLDDSDNPKFQTGITELGTIGSTDNSPAITINPGADTTFYYGGVESGGFRIYLDGTEMTTGYNWDEKYSSFDLPAGKYTVQHTSTNKEGEWDRAWKIEINTIIDNLKIVLTDDQKPTAKTDLKENGKAQELVNAPKAPLEGTAMNYALGKDSSTAPTEGEGWSTSIPTATDAGTYYVWYKAIGDESHSESDANYVKVTIDEKTEAHTHKIVYVEAKEPTCTEDGYEAHYECTVEGCGEWFEDETKSVPIDKEKFIKKATGHKWDKGVVTQEATYDETGIKTYTCSVCGETKGETIPVKTGSSSSSSDSSDSSSGGSNGKTGSISTKSIDVNGNTVQTQPDSGAPLSDRGGNWGNQEYDWTYTKSDGSLAKGEWLNLEYDGHTYWYYFDDSTIMQTNWFDYNGSRYFLVPEMDGWRGRMATGWHMVDNKWYYFEPTIGANQGILYRGMTTPDGHTVGADGAWDGNGTTPVGAVHTGTTVTMN